MLLQVRGRAHAGALILSLIAACDNTSGPGITLDVTPNPAFLVTGDTLRLSVTPLNPDGLLVTGIAVTFEAADTTIITVSNVGVIRSVGPTGVTSVRVVGGGTFRDVPVTVIPQPAFVRVTPADTTLRSGRTVQYIGQVVDVTNTPIPGIPLKWQSTDTNVARVDASGRATSRGPAGVTFIVGSFAGRGAAARLRVATPGVPESLSVTPARVGIDRSAVIQLRAILRDAFGDSVGDAGAVTWESMHPSIVTVSTTGLARSEGPAGSATILARLGSLTGIATIYVLDSLISARVFLDGGSYGAALSSTGVAYLTQPGNAKLVRADLPSQSFATAISVGLVPTEVAFNSNGTRAYVTNQFSHNVSIVNVSANTVIDAIAVTGDPFEVIVAPGDSIVFVSTNVNQVYAIRLASKAVITSFPTPAIGNGMVIRDTLLYVSTHAGGTVIEFNLRTLTVARTFTVGGTPQKMALSGDGNSLYIANEAGYVQVWDLVSGTQDGTNIALPAGSAGYGIALRSSDGRLYVTTAYFGSSGGSIHVIDPVSRALLYTAAAGGSTRRVTFNASGSVGFVPNESGWVDFVR